MNKHVSFVMIGLMMVSVANANLLLNGGFELPGGHSTIDASGHWTEFGTVNQKIQSAAWASNEGLAGAWLHGWNNDRDGGFYQDVTMFAGIECSLSGEFRIETHFVISGHLELALIWLDGEDAVISSEVLDIDAAQAADGVWHMQYVRGYAPAGTAKARSQVYWTTADQTGPNPRWVMVDNLILEPSLCCPEPATLALLGLGALVLRRRK